MEKDTALNQRVVSLEARIKKLETASSTQDRDIVALRTTIEMSDKHISEKFDDLSQRLDKFEANATKASESIHSAISENNRIISSINAEGAVTHQKASNNEKVLFAGITAAITIAAALIGIFMKGGGA